MQDPQSYLETLSEEDDETAQREAADAEYAALFDESSWEVASATHDRLVSPDCTVDTQIRDYISRAQRVKDKWLEHANLLRPMILELETFLTDIQFELPDYLNLSLAGNKASLLRAMRILYKHGYRRSVYSSPPKKKEPNWTGFFNHKDNPEDESDKIFIVYFRFTSTQCRRVLIRTDKKTVVEEEEIYEVQCDDDSTESPLETHSVLTPPA